jgi:predicted peptidase
MSTGESHPKLCEASGRLQKVCGRCFEEYALVVNPNIGGVKIATAMICVSVLISLIFCVDTVFSGAQDKVDGFIGRIYRNKSGQALPYRLYIPDSYDQAKTYPLILWLHGGGGLGNDNRRQISGDQVFALRTWTSPQTQAKYPAFVLAPQSPGSWANLNTNSLTLSEKLTVDIISALEGEFSIDSKRVYISGQSLGGVGTWDLLDKEPDLFAAAIPLCGFGNPAKASRIAKTPVWAFQGADDPTQIGWDSILTGVRLMIAALRQAGGNPKYTEYPGVGHDVWKVAFSESGLVEWLFSQHK